MWRTVTQLPTLRATDVHVWQIPIASFINQFTHYHAILTSDEQQRAAQYRITADRNCYVITRGILRCLLGHYLQASPTALPFGYNQHGKPTLLTEKTIAFNVSHTRECSVIAIGKSPVGIDIELSHRQCAPLSLAKRFFHPTEYDALCALPEREQLAAFIQTWVCKEAWVKASGDGIADTFKQFAVNVNPEQPPAITMANDAMEWQYWPVAPIAQHYAALVTSAMMTHIEFYHVPLELGSHSD